MDARQGEFQLEKKPRQRLLKKEYKKLVKRIRELHIDGFRSITVMMSVLHQEGFRKGDGSQIDYEYFRRLRLRAVEGVRLKKHEPIQPKAEPPKPPQEPPMVAPQPIQETKQEELKFSTLGELVFCGAIILLVMGMIIGIYTVLD